MRERGSGREIVGECERGRYCVCLCVSERGREERQADRQTLKQTDSQTDVLTDRET